MQPTAMCRWYSAFEELDLSLESTSLFFHFTEHSWCGIFEKLLLNDDNIVSYSLFFHFPDSKDRIVGQLLKCPPELFSSWLEYNANAPSNRSTSSSRIAENHHFRLPIFTAEDVRQFEKICENLVSEDDPSMSFDEVEFVSDEDVEGSEDDLDEKFASGDEIDDEE